MKKIKKIKLFKKVEDYDVVTIWKQSCTCEESKNGAEVNTCDFAECGVPICTECGDEMEYVETRVRS